MMGVLGIGVDIVEVARVAKALERYGRKFLERILSAAELELAEGREGAALARFAAGRFAAKEAIWKAMGTGLGDAAWSDISVTNDRRGKPVASLAGVALERASRMGATRLHVSISHAKEYAVAQAVIEGPDVQEVESLEGGYGATDEGDGRPGVE